MLQIHPLVSLGVLVILFLIHALSVTAVRLWVPNEPLQGYLRGGISVAVIFAAALVGYLTRR